MEPPSPTISAPPPPAATQPVPTDGGASPVPQSPPPAGTFYSIDSTRFWLREYWWSSHSPAAFFGWISKWLRIRVTSASDDPNVESLAPFETDEASLPPATLARFEPPTRDLQALGFGCPVFHAIDDPLHNSRIFLATFRHESGRAIARIHQRVWSVRQPPKDKLYTEFLSEFDDHTWLWSLSSTPDMPAPANCRVVRKIAAPPRDLWDLHSRHLTAAAPRPAVVPVRDRDELVRAIERHHATVRDFHTARGVFTPMSDADHKHVETLLANRRAADAGQLQHPEILAEITRLQRKQSSWTGAILLLMVSLAFFLGAGAGSWKLSAPELAVLCAILLIHELGHYLAMRVFRYRNLRLFFIPFFGAAVTGRNYNVPGWKKTIVYLMGPLPGIALGILLGVLSLILHQPLLLKASLLAMILNGFNLLPVLPLDGGWVMHTLLFSRHYLLDVAFRVIAAAALAAAGALLHDRLLLFLGLFMLVGVPLAYRLARIASQLRADFLTAGRAPASPDDQTIPADVAEAIITRLKAAFPRGATNKAIAQHTLNIFETLNARPPRWAITAGFLAIHGLAFAAVILFGLFFVWAQQGGGSLPNLRNLRTVAHPAARPPRHTLDPATLAQWQTTRPPGDRAAPSTQPARNTLIATFPRADDARRAFADLSGLLPPGASMRVFGDTLLLALAPADDAARRQWFARLQKLAPDVFVDSPHLRAGLTLQCAAPGGQAARAIEEEADEYFQVPRQMNLIPPWSPSDARTPEQRARHRLARRTFTKLLHTGSNAYKHPDMRALVHQVTQARRQGDSAEVTRLREQMARLSEDLRRQEIERLRQSPPDEVDLRLIDQYLALPQQQQREGNLEALAPLMGQIPDDDGRPPDEPAQAAAAGYVSRNALVLTFNWLHFNDVVEGAPAIVRWLQSQGCLAFRYDFQSPAVPDEFDPGTD